MRTLFSENPILFKSYAYITGNSFLKDQLSTKKDFAIAGFPRSGNTYSTKVIKSAFPEADFAHHIHKIAPIKVHVKANNPVLILMRHPSESISSLYLFKQEFGFAGSLKILCNEWLSFYDYVLMQKLPVINFEDWINTPIHLISLISEITGNLIPREWEPPTNKGNKNNDKLYSMIPNEKKEFAKTKIKSKLKEESLYSDVLRLYCVVKNGSA